MPRSAASRRRPSGRGDGPRRSRSGLVVDAEATRPGAGEAHGLVTDAAADVERRRRAQALDDLAVPGVVECEQRVGRGALHRALAGELHRCAPRDCRSAGTAGGRREAAAKRRTLAGAARAPGRRGRRCPKLPHRIDVPGLPAARTRSCLSKRGRDPDDVIDKLGDLAARARAAPHQHAGVARPRRPRGRRLGGARVDDRVAVGPGRHRSHDAHVVRAGHAQVAWRDGYRVIRKAGRYMVFPRAAFSEAMGWHGAPRRAGRDLERDAVLLARVVEGAARRVAAPRARRPCGR